FHQSNNNPSFMRKLYYFKVGWIILLMTLNTPLFGQDVPIRGVISDDTGTPIPGASVLVKGTTIGVAADMDGQYELTVPADAVLVFSFIGYQSQEIPVGNQSVINVTLTPEL